MKTEYLQKNKNIQVNQTCQSEKVENLFGFPLEDPSFNFSIMDKT